MVKPSNAATPTQGAATQQRTYTAMRKIITKDGKIIGELGRTLMLLLPLGGRGEGCL